MQVNPETMRQVETFVVIIEIESETLGLASTTIEDALVQAGVENAHVMQVSRQYIPTDDDDG